ncbi:MAG: MoaD/ThiS family protein [Gammaproteobacteria bacterium]|jgi:sulfur-carrier protein
MSITVKYFASLRDRLGREGDRVDGAGTVAEIWQRATGEAELPPNVLIAVNQEYATLDQAVNTGDEVAFFPPVTGG